MKPLDWQSGIRDTGGACVQDYPHSSCPSSLAGQCHDPHRPRMQLSKVAFEPNSSRKAWFDSRPLRDCPSGCFRRAFHPHRELALSSKAGPRGWAPPQRWLRSAPTCELGRVAKRPHQGEDTHPIRNSPLPLPQVLSAARVLQVLICASRSMTTASTLPTPISTAISARMAMHLVGFVVVRIIISPPL